MPEIYTIKKGDWLSKIARLYSFQDGGDRILSENPKLEALINGNRNILPVGFNIKIPDKKEGDAGKPTNSSGIAEIPNNEKKLIVTFLEISNGRDQPKLLDDKWQCKQGDFFNSGREKSNSMPFSFSNGKIVDTFKENELSLIDQIRYYITIGKKDSKENPENIALYIGGMETIATESGKPSFLAVKKILYNLGFISESIYQTIIAEICSLDNDIILREAIRDFQNTKKIETSGLLDAATLQALIEASGLKMAVPAKPETEADTDSEVARIPKILQGKKFAEIQIETIKNTTEYQRPTYVGDTEMTYTPPTYEEPTYVDPVDVTKPRKRRTNLSTVPPRFNRSVAFVAIADKGKEVENKNHICLPPQRFLFLDSGRFYSDGRDFSIIWGKNVYLCTFKNAQIDAKTPTTNRLDDIFFSAMNGCVTIEKQACASWVPDSDFDFNKMYLIIPDMHLMTAHHASIWRSQDPYKYESENDFLEFAKKLKNLANASPEIKKSLMVLQLGDSYDLWVGYPRRSKHNVEDKKHEDGKKIIDKILLGYDDNVESKGVKDDDELLVDKICGEITGWINEIKNNNPASNGLDILEDTFDCIYIHGNHDNYLIRHDIVRRANIAYRDPYKEFPGVFIEHGHRLDGTNHDGTKAGHWFANAAFNTLEFMDNNPLDVLLYPLLAIVLLPLMIIGLIVLPILNLNPLPLLKLLNPSVSSAVQTIKGIEGQNADANDQEEYIKEYTKVFWGRKNIRKNKVVPSENLEGYEKTLLPIHIFVIGHTHAPELLEIHVEQNFTDE
jgi:hypothetical protein